MNDLFGNELPELEPKEKTFEEKYSEYIGSAAWRRLREYKIESVGNACEKCHVSGHTVDLQVHHLTYERFKHERLEDLQVLCQKCHEKADKKRIEIKEEKHTKGKLARGFEEWMDAGKHEHWRRQKDGILEGYWNAFIRELRLPFTPKFHRSANWHESDGYTWHEVK